MCTSGNGPFRLPLSEGLNTHRPRPLGACLSPGTAHLSTFGCFMLLETQHDPLLSLTPPEALAIVTQTVCMRRTFILGEGDLMGVTMAPRAWE